MVSIGVCKLGRLEGQQTFLNPDQGLILYCTVGTLVSMHKGKRATLGEDRRNWAWTEPSDQSKRRLDVFYPGYGGKISIVLVAYRTMGILPSTKRQYLGFLLSD